jgi:hypothetical protein
MPGTARIPALIPNKTQQSLYLTQHNAVAPFSALGPRRRGHSNLKSTRTPQEALRTAGGYWSEYPIVWLPNRDAMSYLHAR